MHKETDLPPEAGFFITKIQNDLVVSIIFLIFASDN